MAYKTRKKRVKKNVPEGVYFIVVEAVGADGVNYKIKSDINILR